MPICRNCSKRFRCNLSCFIPKRIKNPNHKECLCHICWSKLYSRGKDSNWWKIFHCWKSISDPYSIWKQEVIQDV